MVDDGGAEPGGGAGRREHLVGTGRSGRPSSRSSRPLAAATTRHAGVRPATGSASVRPGAGERSRAVCSGRRSVYRRPAGRTGRAAAAQRPGRDVRRRRRPRSPIRRSSSQPSRERSGSTAIAASSRSAGGEPGRGRVDDDAVLGRRHPAGEREVDEQRRRGRRAEQDQPVRSAGRPCPGTARRPAPPPRRDAAPSRTQSRSGRRAPESSARGERRDHGPPRLGGRAPGTDDRAEPPVGGLRPAGRRDPAGRRRRLAARRRHGRALRAEPDPRPAGRAGDPARSARSRSTAT